MSFGTRSEVCIILFTHFSPFYLLYFLISICSSVWSFLYLYVNSMFVAEYLNVLFNVSFISSFSFLICFCKSVWFFFQILYKLWRPISACPSVFLYAVCIFFTLSLVYFLTFEYVSLRNGSLRVCQCLSLSYLSLSVLYIYR